MGQVEFVQVGLPVEVFVVEMRFRMANPKPLVVVMLFRWWLW